MTGFFAPATIGAKWLELLFFITRSHGYGPDCAVLATISGRGIYRFAAVAVSARP